MISELFALIRALPDLLVDRIERWLQRVHGPHSVGDGHLVWCLQCKVRWPCPEFVKVHARWSARREAKA